MANYNYLLDTGLIIPDTSQTRNEVIEEFKAVFGNDLETDPSTPAGQLITRITEERDAIARNNAELANQINPDIAGGIFLDAIWRLSDGFRNEATHSLLLGVELKGIPGTIINAGSIATAGEYEFELTHTKILNNNGEATGDFRAVEAGAIQVLAHELDSVASSILGWEQVDNPIKAILGREVESDAEARRRRKLTLAVQSNATNEAIVGRLLEIPEVRSLSFLENYTNTQDTIDGITLDPHSIWVCVEGGTDVEIAEALYRSKSAGAGYNGATQVTVQDSINGEDYTVAFDRPVEKNILIRVTVKPTTIDVQTVIPNIVMDYVNGNIEGDVSFIVGSDVSPWEISGAINQVAPELHVLGVEIAPQGTSSWSSNVYAIGADEVARTSLSSIQVVIS